MKNVSIPRLPAPSEIRAEIKRLKAHIGELKALLPAAEQQHLSHAMSQADSERQVPQADESRAPIGTEGQPSQ